MADPTNTEEKGDKIVLEAVSDLSAAISQMEALVGQLRSMQDAFKGAEAGAEKTSDAIEKLTDAAKRAQEEAKKAAQGTVTTEQRLQALFEETEKKHADTLSKITLGLNTFFGLVKRPLEGVQQIWRHTISTMEAGTVSFVRQLSVGFLAARTEMGAFAAAARIAGAVVSQLGTVIAGGITLILGGLAYAATKTAIAFGDFVQHLRNQAAIIGVSVQFYQELTQRMAEVGLRAESSRHAIIQFSRAIQGAATNSGKHAELFNSLGVSVVKASGAVRPLPEVLYDVAVALNRMEDGTRKTVVQAELFGRFGAQLIPMLKQMAEEGENGRRSFFQLSTSVLESGDRVNNAYSRLGNAVTNLKNAMRGWITLAMEPLAVWFSVKLTAAIDAFLSKEHEITAFMDRVGDKILRIVEAMDRVGAVLKQGRDASLGGMYNMLALLAGEDVDWQKNRRPGYATKDFLSDKFAGEGGRSRADIEGYFSELEKLSGSKLEFKQEANDEGTVDFFVEANGKKIESVKDLMLVISEYRLKQKEGAETERGLTEEELKLRREANTEAMRQANEQKAALAEQTQGKLAALNIRRRFELDAMDEEFAIQTAHQERLIAQGKSDGTALLHLKEVQQKQKEAKISEFDTQEQQIAHAQGEALTQIEIESVSRRSLAVLAAEEAADRRSLALREITEDEATRRAIDREQRRFEIEVRGMEARLRALAVEPEAREQIEQQIEALKEGHAQRAADLSTQEIRQLEERARRERDMLLELRDLQLEAFGTPLQQQLQRLTNNYLHMVERFKDAGLEEHLGELTAAFKQMEAEAGGAVRDLTGTYESALSQLFQAVVNKDRSIGDVFKNLGRSIVGTLSDAFAEAIVKKLDFDAKFRINVQEDLPEIAGVGGAKTGSAFLKPIMAAWNFISGGTSGTAPSPAVDASGRISGGGISAPQGAVPAQLVSYTAGNVPAGAAGAGGYVTGLSESGQLLTQGTATGAGTVLAADTAVGGAAAVSGGGTAALSGVAGYAGGILTSIGIDFLQSQDGGKQVAGIFAAGVGAGLSVGAATSAAAAAGLIGGSVSGVAAGAATAGAAIPIAALVLNFLKYSQPKRSHVSQVGVSLKSLLDETGIPIPPSVMAGKILSPFLITDSPSNSRSDPIYPDVRLPESYGTSPGLRFTQDINVDRGARAREVTADADTNPTPYQDVLAGLLYDPNWRSTVHTTSASELQAKYVQPIKGLLNVAAAKHLAPEDAENLIRRVVTKGGGNLEDTIGLLAERLYGHAPGPIDTSSLAGNDLVGGIAGAIKAFYDIPAAVDAMKLAFGAVTKDGLISPAALQRQIDTALKTAKDLDIGGVTAAGLGGGGPRGFLTQLRTNAKTSVAQSIFAALGESQIAGEPFKAYIAKAHETTEAFYQGDLERGNMLLGELKDEWEKAEKAAEQYFYRVREEAPALAEFLLGVTADALTASFTNATAQQTIQAYFDALIPEAMTDKEKDAEEKRKALDRRAHALNQQVGQLDLGRIDLAISQARLFNDEVLVAQLEMDRYARQSQLELEQKQFEEEQLANKPITPHEAFMKSLKDSLRSSIIQTITQAFIEAGVVQQALAPFYEKLQAIFKIIADPSSTPTEVQAAFADLDTVLNDLGSVAATVEGRLAQVGDHVSRSTLGEYFGITPPEGSPVAATPGKTKTKPGSNVENRPRPTSDEDDVARPGSSYAATGGIYIDLRGGVVLDTQTAIDLANRVGEVIYDRSQLNMPMGS